MVNSIGSLLFIRKFLRLLTRQFLWSARILEVSSWAQLRDKFGVGRLFWRVSLFAYCVEPHLFSLRVLMLPVGGCRRWAMGGRITEHLLNHETIWNKTPWCCKYSLMRGLYIFYKNLIYLAYFGRLRWILFLFFKLPMQLACRLHLSSKPSKLSNSKT